VRQRADGRASAHPPGVTTGTMTPTGLRLRPRAIHLVRSLGSLLASAGKAPRRLWGDYSHTPPRGCAAGRDLTDGDGANARNVQTPRVRSHWHANPWQEASTYDDVGEAKARLWASRRRRRRRK